MSHPACWSWSSGRIHTSSIRVDTGLFSTFTSMLLGCRWQVGKFGVGAIIGSHVRHSPRYPGLLIIVGQPVSLGGQGSAQGVRLRFARPAVTVRASFVSLACAEQGQGCVRPSRVKPLRAGNEELRSASVGKQWELGVKCLGGCGSKHHCHGLWESQCEFSLLFCAICCGIRKPAGGANSNAGSRAVPAMAG